MKNLDEKCLAILEKMGSFMGPMSIGDTYRAAKPTQYPAHMKRLNEMEEAGLIEVRHVDYRGITSFGENVLRELKIQE
jgi:hypothetical protein